MALSEKALEALELEAKIDETYAVVVDIYGYNDTHRRNCIRWYIQTLPCDCELSKTKEN